LALALAKNGTETKLAIKFKTSNDMQYKSSDSFSFWKFGVNFPIFCHERLQARVSYKSFPENAYSICRLHYLHENAS
jgi:hypothetical protein